MIVALAISALAMVDLSQRVLITQNGLAIEELRVELREAKRERQRLEMTLLPMQSPGRIESQAMGKLRMVRPERVSYIQLPSPAGRGETGSRAATAESANRRPGKRSSGVQLLRTVLDQLGGHVQLLPLGNIAAPID